MARIVQIARYQADGTQVTRTFEQMGREGEKMSQRVQKGAASMSPALKGIDAAAGVAQQKLQGLAGSAGSLGTVLTAIGPAGLAAAAAIGALALGFTALQRASIDAMRQIADIDGVANRLGVATDFVQEFRYAVTGTGGDIAIADAALLAFSRNLGQLNTELGKRARGAMEELGFSDEEIRNMRSVEQALPQIIERIGQVGSASEQAAIAQKLGLEGVLETLQGGEDAFEALREQARATGFVLDRDLIVRMAELEDQWKLAKLQMDANTAVILSELAPAFVELSKVIAGAARELRDFLDGWRDVELIGAREANRRSTEIGSAQVRLLARHGAQNLQGGDAARGERILGFTGLNPAAGLENIGGAQDARDIYAALEARGRALLQRMSALDAAVGATGGASGDRPGPTAPDAELARMRQFVEQLEAEAATRARLGELRAENAKASDAELRAVVALEADLQTLAQARERGVIASDEELLRLQMLRVARDKEADAIARQQQELARLDRIRAENDRLRAQVETPEARIRREIADLEKESAEGVGRDPALIAQRIRQLREEYRELAGAQYEASIQGRILSGVMQGQIRDADDLKRALFAIFADAAMRELMMGPVSGEGGIGGFFGRVLERAGVGGFGSVFGSGGGFSVPGFGGGMIEMGGKGPAEAAEALAEGAREAAGQLVEAFTPSLAESVSKLAISSVATARESAAKTTGAATTANLTLAMKAAANAAREFAAAAGGGGDSGKGILGAVIGAGKSLIMGGGRSGGGSLFPGARHRGAELGPELAIFGGWGQAAPTQAVEGLGVLSRLARLADAPPPSGSFGAPRVNVSLFNESGAGLDASADARVGADGQIEVDVLLLRAVGQQVAQGDHDDAFQSRFRMRRTRVPR